MSKGPISGTQSKSAPIARGIVDPSVSGYPAPIGFIYLHKTDGSAWKKVGPNDNDWTKLGADIDLSDYAKIEDIANDDNLSEYAQDIIKRVVLNQMSNTFLTGFRLRANTDTTKFDIYKGSDNSNTAEFIVNYNDPLHPVKPPLLTIPDQIGLVATNLGTGNATYVAIDSSGTIHQSNVFYTYDELADLAIIGTLITSDGVHISAVSESQEYGISVFTKLRNFLISFGRFNDSGNVYYEHGSDLYLRKSPGITFAQGTQYRNGKKSVDFHPDQEILENCYRRYAYTNSQGVWGAGSVGLSIDPNQYDTLHGLASIPAGKWGVHYLFWVTDFGLTYVQYPQHYYDTLEDAQSHKEDFIVDPLLTWGTFRAWLIVQQGATSLRSIDGKAKFITGPKWGLSSVASAGAGGEANTASNVGLSGIGLFLGKLGIDLQFKNLASPLETINITNNPSDKTVEIDVNPENISHTDLKDIGLASHDAIDTALGRLADTSGTNTGDGAGKDTAQWNANKIKDKTFPALDIIDDGKVPKYNHGLSAFEMVPMSGGSGGGGLGIDGIDGEDGIPIPGPRGADGPASTVPGPRGFSIQGEQGEPGEDAVPIPGPRGLTGPAGPQQPVINIPGDTGDTGEDGFPIPGNIGPPGATVVGPQGPAGAGVPGEQGDQGEDGYPIPGNKGDKGATGAAGLVINIPGDQGEPGEDGFPIPGPVGPVSTIPGPTGPQGLVVNIPGDSGDSGEDGFPIPGGKGDKGDIGGIGPAGPIGIGVPGVDGLDGEDGWPIPGQIGQPGPASTVPGPQGIPGMGLPGMDGNDGEDGLSIPGSGGFPSGLFIDVVGNYGASGNAKTVFDGACNTAAPTKITSATAAFVSGDINKRITLAGAGASGDMYVGIITAIDSTTQVTVSPSISTTVSTKGLTYGTDDTIPIQNAINAASGLFPGIIMYFRPTQTNRFLVTNTLLAVQTINMLGQGGAHTTDIGDYTKAGGTWLVWNRNESLPLLSIIPTAGASNTAVVAPKIRGMNFDCRNGDQYQALYGIQLQSAHGFFFEDFFIMDALAVGLDIQTIQGSLGEAKDPTRGLLSRFSIRELDANQAALGSTTTTGTGTFSTSSFSLAITSGANFTTAGYVWVMSNLGYYVLVKYTGGGGTTTLTGCTVDAQEVLNAPTWVAAATVVQCSPSNASCMRMDGVSTANSCESLMVMGQLSHGTTAGPAGIEFKNADSWECIKIIINGGNITSDGAVNRIRKPGVRFNGSNTSASFTARNNVFHGCSAGAGGASSMGVNNAGTRFTYLSGPNYWELYELGNGEAIPVIEGNAFLDWRPNGGWRSGAGISTAAIADQALGAGASALVVGSLVAVPPQGFQIGTVIRWTFRCSKTAAGVAARTFYIRCGTGGVVGDAAIATFTVPLGTAVIDNGYGIIELVIRGPLGASCAGVATLFFSHNLQITGFMTIPNAVVAGTMATWNSGTAGLFLSVSFTAGASEIVTFQQMQAECVNSSNP